MKFKQTFLFVFAAVLTLSAYAQKKPKINKANSARESGELAEAKSIIDAAIEHEKTKDDAKTWYYRGLIYATLDTTSNEQFSGLTDNALEEATKAFDKASELDPDEKGLYVTGDMGIPVLMDQQVNGYYSYYYNTAVEAFSSNEYETAVSNFENAAYIIKDDTGAVVNAAFAAHNGELYDAAIKNYRAAMDRGAQSIDLYYNLLNILVAAKKDNDAALALVNEGLEKFPNDPVLTKNRINLLINMDKVEDAKADLKNAIKAEPENPDLYFTLGVLLEETEDIDGAIEAYKKAIEVKPDHFESNFNYGVILINAANDVIKEVNKLGMSKADQKKAREMQPVIEDKLQAALPQWERVYEINPDETQAIETLAYIYNQLGMKEKYKEMSSKLN